MKAALKKTLQTYQMALPIMISIFLLINLVNPFLRDYYVKIFKGVYWLDPILGAMFGSISFGIPITSYIVGGELLERGVSLLAITAFIMSWTTVGVALLPLESKFFGKRFAFARNGINFVFSILIAIITVIILGVL